MPAMALGTTTIENIVAHDAAALEKDLASIDPDAAADAARRAADRHALQQMLVDPDVGIPQLVPVINYEPVLVGRVLQMANSAALNPTRRQITDLRTGVTRVGFDLLRSAALAYALRQVSQAHSVKDIRPHLEALWERSAWTAAVSFVIARKFTTRESRHRLPRRAHARRRQAVHPDARRAFSVRVARSHQVRRNPAQVACAVRAAPSSPAGASTTKSSRPSCNYENLNREVVGDEPDLTDILATSYLVVGHAGRMQDLSMTVEKIASFSRLRLDLMAVEETLEQAREEIEDLRLAIALSRGALRGGSGATSVDASQSRSHGVRGQDRVTRRRLLADGQARSVDGGAARLCHRHLAADRHCPRRTAGCMAGRSCPECSSAHSS